jgi:NAD(P)-dependent dehydrogenase (short-subunit alcohol dehydrogenase family)
MKNTV